ncbi:hypothetical protein DH2020_024592 [Rehmannia glutinosa]|uniref:Transcriptional corepressor LEUNIG-like protein n=1 Tax=Rehmannia glutinosa TaxID=99300 RepID=A0ABR0W4T3_REHGL
MAQSNWEADKMLDVYIHDYLLKRKLHNSAKAFMTEGKVASDPVAIDAPGGFLFEWWSVFWDIFIARTNEKHSEAAAAYIEVSQESATVDARQFREHVCSLAANARRPQLATDIKAEVNLGATQKSLPMDPSSIYGQAILQSKSGLGGAGKVHQGTKVPWSLGTGHARLIENHQLFVISGLSQGVTGLPLKGWPLTGIDQLRPSMGLQVQKPNLQTQNQFLLASQQQQVLAQAQAQGNLGNSANYGFGGLPRGNFNAKDGQPPRNDGSICSPVQSNSPKGQIEDHRLLLLRSYACVILTKDFEIWANCQNMAKMTNRKRKQHSSSGPANSTGTGNTVGPSPGSPQSTHTPGDGMTTASSLQHVNSVSKSMMMYGAEGAGGIASSTNQLDDLENFGDVGSLEDNVDSFLSHDGGDGNLYGSLKQTLTEHKTETSKGFSFGEVGCIRTRNKVTCCHFSSDGKLLASAGHDKKPSYCLHAYTGHTSHVMSLDFHPKKNDLFCFCDSNNEIHYWSISPFSCTRVSKQGGSAQVRFQPITGHLLAAASDKVVSIFDVESDRQTHSFQGHSGVVNYLCWDLNGDLLASVSEDSIKVWSLASGECIHELNANGNQFHSCVFHPSYSALLVIGGLRSLELWNMVENKSMTVPAHENIVAALAQSPLTGMVASASHDSSVKDTWGLFYSDSRRNAEAGGSNLVFLLLKSYD